MTDQTSPSTSESPKHTADEPVESQPDPNERRNRVEWAVLRALLGVVGHACWARLDALIGEVAWYALPSRRAVAVDNVVRSLAPRGVARREARRIAHASFRHFGRTLGAALRLDAGEPVVRWNRPNALEDLIRTHQPAMILSGHLGNWELAAWRFNAARTLRQATESHRRTNTNPHTARYVANSVKNWCRAARSCRSFVWARRALERGSSSVRRDQYPGVDAVRCGAVFTVPFLGRETPFAATLFRLAERTSTSIIGISAILAKDGSYDIHTESVPTGDAEAMCRHWVRWLEMQILEYPAQYLWMHRRWKDYGT